MANNSRTKRKLALNNKLKKENIVTKKRNDNSSIKQTVDSKTVTETIEILDDMLSYESEDTEEIQSTNKTDSIIIDQNITPFKIAEKTKKHLKNKYFVMLSVLLCVITFIAVVGISYSFFTFSTRGKDFIVYTGNLAVDYQKKTDVLNIENVYPMTDVEGLTLLPHEFTITNNGNIDARYQVRLELDTTVLDMVDIQYIKISYKENNGDYSTPVLLSDLNSSLVFVKDVIISPSQSNDYAIKIWIDLNAPNDIQGKIFRAKVVVDSIQNVEDGYIVDTAPIIYLNSDNYGNQDIHLRTNEVYNELGVNRVEDDQEVFSTNQVQLSYEYYDGSNLNAVDNIDTSRNGIYYVNYSITDKSGNIGKTARIVTVNPIDTIPSITLNGSETISLGEGYLYKDKGVTVTDGNYVVTIGEVKTSTIGTYTVRYIVIDANGNMNSVIRMVNVIPIYRETLLNGADPVLTDNLIPVIINENGTVKKADIVNKWYSYGEKNWANAVVLREDASVEEDGSIKEENIESYFVWIPKYKYKIFNDGNYTTADGYNTTIPSAIDIRFGLTNTSDSVIGECTTSGVAGKGENCTVGDYMTHPSFLAFDVNGLWVGKFETGYDGATNSTDSDVMNTPSPSMVIVKPDVYSWRYATLGTMFQTSYEYLRDEDSHMMKNTEWGAVAYLTNSIYGRCNDITCTEIGLNKTAYITGYIYSVVENGFSNLNYFENRLGSTTDNRSGIYDMAGGAEEYVMGYTTGTSPEGGSSGITALYPDFFTNSDWNKYYDKYTSTANLDYNNRILGDATGEMGPFSAFQSSWYQDRARFVMSGAPWFRRGGSNGSQNAYIGIFAFERDTGIGNRNYSFRIVLAPK